MEGLTRRQVFAATGAVGATALLAGASSAEADKEATDKILAGLDKLKARARKEKLHLQSISAETLRLKLRTAAVPTITSLYYTSEIAPGKDFTFGVRVFNPGPDYVYPAAVSLFVGLSTFLENGGVLARDTSWPYFSSKPFRLESMQSADKEFKITAPGTLTLTSFPFNALLYYNGLFHKGILWDQATALIPVTGSAP